MADTLSKLFVVLGLKTNEFSDGLKELRKETGAFNKDLGTVFGGLVPTISIAAAVAGFGAMMVNAANLGESITNMSIRTGMSTDAIQKLGNAAKLSGGSLESLEQVIKLMQTSIGQAAISGGAAAESFSRLGLNMAQLKNLSPEQQFYAIADAIEQIPDPSTKVAAYRDIFGRSGTEVALYISNLKEAGSLPIMTPEQIANLAAGKEAMEKMEIAWNAVVATFASTVWPLVTPFLEVLKSVFETIQNIRTALDSLGGWGDFMRRAAIGAGPLGMMVTGLPQFATGGIAWQPQIASLAENGPEAIIPLSKLSGAGGGVTNININPGVFMGNEEGARQVALLVRRYLVKEGASF